MTTLTERIDNHTATEHSELEPRPQTDTLPSWDDFEAEHASAADRIRRAWVRSDRFIELLSDFIDACGHGTNDEIFAASRELAEARDAWRAAGMRASLT